MWLIPAVGLHVAPENKKAPEAVRLRCTTIGRLCPEPDGSKSTTTRLAVEPQDIICKRCANVVTPLTH